MPVRELICLANSYKHGGRCVAGLTTDGTGWLRPISALPDGILHAADYTLADDSAARPLDVLRIELQTPKPDPHHPENWLLARNRWRLTSRPLPASLFSVLQKGISDKSELLRGTLDQLPFANLLETPAQASLTLVAPTHLFLYRHQEGVAKPRVRGRFQLGPQQTWYDLGVTDPHWIDAILRDGDEDLFQAEQRFVLTISLSEPYHGQCYKLIAAIIPLPVSWPG